MSSGRRTGTNELTPRESEVYELVLQNLSNREIAHLLGIRKATVRDHLNELHAKLGSDGSRESLKTNGNGRSSKIFALFGGIAAVGSAAAVGIGILAFVVMNTGEGVDGLDPPVVAEADFGHCAGSLSVDLGTDAEADDCPGGALPE